jgi:hypothetical protein
VARSGTCSLCRTAETWLRTVTGETKSRAAISAVVSPWRKNSSTSHSRVVRSTPRRPLRGRRFLVVRARNSSTRAGHEVARQRGLAFEHTAQGQVEPVEIHALQQVSVVCSGMVGSPVVP